MSGTGVWRKGREGMWARARGEKRRQAGRGPVKRSPLPDLSHGAYTPFPEGLRGTLQARIADEQATHILLLVAVETGG